MDVQTAFAALDKAVEFYGDCAKDYAREQAILEDMCHAEEIVEEGIRALALAAHVEACGLTHAGDDWRQCGDGWYCPQAEALKKLGA